MSTKQDNKNKIEQHKPRFLLLISDYGAGSLLASVKYFKLDTIDIENPNISHLLLQY